MITQYTLGEMPWWALMQDEQGRYHVVPWDEGTQSIAKEHVVGECWCQPDEEESVIWGRLYLHREPTWLNSAESVN